MTIWYKRGDSPWRKHVGYSDDEYHITPVDMARITIRTTPPLPPLPPEPLPGWYYCGASDCENVYHRSGAGGWTKFFGGTADPICTSTTIRWNEIGYCGVHLKPICE